MFWEAIERLHRWEREHIPGADTPQGSEVLVWLLRSQEKPRPLKNLYRSSRYSEPTVRACIKSFVDNGFIVLESSGSDLRTRYARATDKLRGRIREYQDRFKEVAALAEREGLVVPTRGAGLSAPPLAKPDGTGPCQL